MSCSCAGSANGATKRAVLKLLKQEPLSSVPSVIVYCTFQAQADQVAQFLYAQGIRALSYHAGKSFKVCLLTATITLKPLSAATQQAFVIHCG